MRSRTDESKREQETRRALLTLCARYMQSAGYTEASAKLIHDSGLNLEKFDIADNIDLPIILKEYEEYYTLKYSRPPKFIRVSEGPPKSSRAPIPKGKVQARKTSNSHIEQKPDPLELSGKAINVIYIEKPSEPDIESHEEFYENRLLKPLPDFHGESKELALTIYRDICQSNPNVHFSQVIGLTATKRLLKEAVLMPMKYPHLFTGILEPWKGVLLFGPPGTGKTMLAKAVATECRTTFFNISASSIVSKWRGDSEKLVRVLFELAAYYEPSTIFIDEIDSIMSERDAGEHEGSRRMKTELLIELDGLVKNNTQIFLLAASNLPWDLDMALLRRLEKRIIVPLPEERTRNELIEELIPEEKTIDFDYEGYARRLEGYSGSDIKLICKEAAMKPLRRLMSRLEDTDENATMNWHMPAEPSSIPEPGPVTGQDFLEAIEATKKSSEVNEEVYEKWFREFGSL